MYELKQPIKIIIADDHKVLLDGLQALLSDVSDIQIVSLANNGEEVLSKMKSHDVDVLMMDIQMPLKNGFETAVEMARDYPETRILILSMHSEKAFIEKMYHLGVSGYLLKSASKEEIVEAIRKVAEGKRYFSDEVTSAILENKTISNSIISPELTRREREILKLIAQGKNNPGIAEILFLSVDTVKTHRKNLMRKLDINNTAGLVKYALEHLTA